MSRLLNCAVKLGEMISEFDNSIDEIMYEDMIEAAADILDAINDFLNVHFTNLSQKNMDTYIKRFPKFPYTKMKEMLNHLSPDDTDQIVEDDVVEEKSMLKS